MGNQALFGYAINRGGDPSYVIEKRKEGEEWRKTPSAIWLKEKCIAFGLSGGGGKKVLQKR